MPRPGAAPPVEAPAPAAPPTGGPISAHAPATREAAGPPASSPPISPSSARCPWTVSSTRVGCSAAPALLRCTTLRQPGVSARRRSMSTRYLLCCPLWIALQHKDGQYGRRALLPVPSLLVRRPEGRGGEVLRC